MYVFYVRFKVFTLIVAAGGIVVMAMDQEALDQHTRTTRDLREVDEYMGRFFQPGDRDAAVSNMAPRRCNISMTLPTRTAGVSPQQFK